MSGHTPGPWTIVDNRSLNDALWIGAHDPEGGYATHAEVRYGCGEAEEMGDLWANAHLICAAPDLIAFAESFREAMRFGSWNVTAEQWAELGRECSAAIAKARNP